MIRIIRNATIGDTYDKLDAEHRKRLLDPPEEPLVLDDPGLQLSISLYLDTQNASQETYTAVRKTILRHNNDNPILTFDQVKRCMTDLSGIVSITHDMCINSCQAFTGPWAAHDHCSYCGEVRYDPILSKPNKNVPRQQFHTIPIGLQLQALWRTSQGAQDIRYRERRTVEILAELEGNDGAIGVYDDIFCGREYLDAAIDGRIKSGDMVLMLSIDGAQLYRNKKSDTWVYVRDLGSISITGQALK